MQNKKKVWVQGFSHIMLGLADEPEQKSSHHHEGRKQAQHMRSQNEWPSEEIGPCEAKKLAERRSWPSGRRISEISIFWFKIFIPNHSATRFAGPFFSSPSGSIEGRGGRGTSQ